MSEGRRKRGLPRAAIALAACAGLVALATPGADAPIGSAALAADDGAVREVARTASGGYSVHASSSEMPRLLRAVGDEAGFTVLDSGKFQLPITFTIDDAPLDVTLRRILRDANFIIVYRGGKRGTEISPEGIEQIILLSPAGGVQGKQPPPASPLAGPHVAGAPPPPGQAPPMPPPARAHRLKGRDAEAAATAAAANPEAYPPGLAPGQHAPNAAIPPEVAGGAGQPTHEELTEGAIGMAGAAGAVEAMPPDDATLDGEE